MDQPVFVIEIPPLSDEAVAEIHAFLMDLNLAFESRFYHQLQRYSRQTQQEEYPSFIQDQDPF